MAASLITIVVIGFILYHSISGVVLDETLANNKMAVEKSGIYIASYVDRMKGLTRIIAENPATIRYLSDGGGRSPDAKDILDMIASSVSSDAFISSIIIVGKDGQLLSNEASLDMSMSDDMMKESWYVAAIEAGTMPSLTSARMQKFNMDKDNWVISISREIKGYSDENIGVLVVDFKYSVIEDYLKDLNLGSEGYAFILNENNEVVYHMDTDYFRDTAKQEALISMSESETGYDQEANLLVDQYKLTNADWTLIGVSSLDGLNVIRQQLVETIVFVGVMCLIFVVIIGTFIAGRITKPINHLEEVMGDIESGFKHIEIEHSGSYEVQSLSQNYNNMMTQIQGLIKDVSSKEQAIRAYELTALHSQINPHFLYNTLDTIVWMAEFNDSQKVIQVTKALARFFRLSLSGGSEYVSITSEIDHVRQYLIIQKERYGDQLNYSIEEEEGIKDVMIPKIIIQPIVENAIYHGIRDLDVPGNITINVSKVGKDIWFVIKDNGHGYVVGELKKPIKTGNAKLGGVGLHNVDQRLKLSYGEDYGVFVESTVHVGTTVTIKIKHEQRL